MPSSIFSFKRHLYVALGTAILSSVLFVAASEALVRNKIVPRHPFYKYIDVFRNSPNPNAIFGDSHFAYGIAGLNGFTNVAYPGNNFRSISEKVRLYFADRQPGRVILQAGVHHFSQNFLFRRPNESRSIADDLRPQSAFKFMMFHNQHRPHLFDYWEIYLDGREFDPTTQFVTEENRENEPNYLDVAPRIRRIASSRISRILMPVEAFQDTSIARLYEKTITDLKQRGAQICLVTLPVVVELRSEMKRNPVFEKTTAYFRDLAERSRVRYRNYLFTEFPGHYFSDPHHLNIIGARAVSPQIEQDCFGSPSPDPIR
jgi:hypothetical protein